MQSKNIEDSYSEIEVYRNDEKKIRVKVRQLENELETNLKRLDIICKSKGLPRVLGANRRTGGGSYASPYG